MNSFLNGEKSDFDLILTHLMHVPCFLGGNMPMRTGGNRRPFSCFGAVLNAKADEYILTKTMDFASTDRNRICMLLFVVVTHELHMHY